MVWDLHIVVTLNKNWWSDDSSEEVEIEHDETAEFDIDISFECDEPSVRKILAQVFTDFAKTSVGAGTYSIDINDEETTCFDSLNENHFSLLNSSCEINVLYETEEHVYNDEESIKRYKNNLVKCFQSYCLLK